MAFFSSYILYAAAVLGYPHWHAAFPVRRPRLFTHVLCNSPYRLKQAQNMSGSVLLTTEASQLSVRIVEEAAWCKIFQAKSSVQFLISDKSLMKSVLPFVRRFSTPTLFHMTILISCSAKHPPRTVLESVYPSELPTIMKSFFLCYGDETPGSVEPFGEHDSCF